MTVEHYLRYMNQPLSEKEKQILISAGWAFTNHHHIEKIGDDGGEHVHGRPAIRNILLSLKYKDLYLKYNGRSKDILDEIMTMERE